MTSYASPRTRAGVAPRTIALAGANVIAIVAGLVGLIELVGRGNDAYIFSGLGGALYTIVGSVILYRRPGHGIGRLMLAVGVALAGAQLLTFVMSIVDPFGFRLRTLYDLAALVSESAQNLGILGGSVVLVAWFPDGRRTSRLGGLVEIMVVAFVVVQLVSQFNRGLDERLSAVAFTALIGTFAIAFADLLLRYRGSDGVRRAQIRWVLAASGLTVILVLLMLAFGDEFDGLWAAWIFSTLLPAVAIGIAITRYRLYDIDRIISSTVSYGSVTLILFGLFWAVNLTLVHAITPLAGGGAFTVATSTLVVAALFNPIRRRIQSIVDRRFHRAHYDAERLVAGLAGRLRVGLDLASVQTEVVATVEGSVEPASMVLWLRGEPSDGADRIASGPA